MSKKLRAKPDSNDDKTHTVRLRLSKYRRIIRLTNLFAASLLGGVTIYAAVKFGGTNSSSVAILGAVILTLVIVSGILLALSRGKVEWQADLLDRYIALGLLDSDTRMSEIVEKTRDSALTAEWPSGERRDRRGALVSMVIAGVLLLMWIWLSALQHTPQNAVASPISVMFDAGRSDLHPITQARLRQIAGELVASTGRIRIEGHADSEGPDDYNLKLSQLRAETVRSALIEAGVSAVRISVFAYGETKPLLNNTSHFWRVQNRRVEIYLEGR